MGFLWWSSIPQIQPAQAVTLQELEQPWIGSGFQGAGAEFGIWAGAWDEIPLQAALGDPEPQESWNNSEFVNKQQLQNGWDEASHFTFSPFFLSGLMHF